MKLSSTIIFASTISAIHGTWYTKSTDYDVYVVIVVDWQYIYIVLNSIWLDTTTTTIWRGGNVDRRRTIHDHDDVII
jgi:hypothetical protein